MGKAQHRAGRRKSEPRARRAEALEEWAERVDVADLREADTEGLRLIVELANGPRREVSNGLAAC